MLKDFKAFVMRGNVLDLAVAVVVGGAFSKIVTSFVDDVLMPPLGLLLSAAVASLLQRILYGVVPHDPKTLLGTAALLVAVVIGASALPARRATRIDPVDALRQD